MTPDCEEFYRRRDKRTKQYLDRALPIGAHVCIAAGGAASRSPAGQLLLLSLANQAARAHRRINFVLPEDAARVEFRSPLSSERALGDALIDVCQSIDPCGKFELLHDPPESADVSVAIGAASGDSGFDWYLGVEGSVGRLSGQPCSFPANGNEGNMRGAAVASCLGAAAIFRTSLGLAVRPCSLSSWNYREGEEAALGPSGHTPVDVGTVLVVGAGAVGSALAYWADALGADGNWTVVDKDLVELHNTNRGLLFLPSQAGWPRGEPEHKSKIVARYFPGGSPPVKEWYDESDRLDERFDVVLCLANERDVRTLVAQRHATVVLHATTGEQWLSQMHRHIAGRDDCIRCRTNDVRELAFGCSAAPLPKEGNGVAEPEENSPDAALPFLSAASGLMLYTALQRLQAGVLPRGAWNDWRWYFDFEHKISKRGKRKCKASCEVPIGAEVRQMANADTRWNHLDGSVR